MSEQNKEIIINNLSFLGKEGASLFEKRMAHLGELAEELCEEAGEDEIFFRDPTFLASYRAIAKTLGSDGDHGMSPVNLPRYRSLRQILSSCERAVICKRLSDSLGIRGLQGASTFFDELGDSVNETVSYVKSSYANTAYSKFSEQMERPKVKYRHEFAEACEDVYYGRSGYCILPIESSSDGYLEGFRALAMKYSLKIASVYKVKLSNEGDYTSFALFRREIFIPEKDGEYSLEVRLNAGTELLSLFSASEIFNMHHKRVETVGDGAYDVVFRIDGDGICGFLSFLYLEYPDFIPIGIYDEN